MSQTARQVLLALACLGMLIPPSATFAAAPIVGGDVQLGTGGLLQGQVTDPTGEPLPSVSVTLWYNQQQIAGVVSDDLGRFAIRGVRTGSYQLVAGGQTTNLRAWAMQVAPPMARPTAQVIASKTIVRGQYPPHPVLSALQRPVVQWTLVGLGIGSAYAIGYNAGLDNAPASP